MPSPKWALRWLLFSPVPSQRTFESLGSMAMQQRVKTPLLSKIGEKVFQAGDVIAMPTGTIHSVINESDQVTLSLHVYGKHINFTQRSQFDLDGHTEKPFVVQID